MSFPKGSDENDYDVAEVGKDKYEITEPKHIKEIMGMLRSCYEPGYNIIPSKIVFLQPKKRSAIPAIQPVILCHFSTESGLPPVPISIPYANDMVSRVINYLGRIKRPKSTPPENPIKILEENTIIAENIVIPKTFETSIYNGIQVRLSIAQSSNRDGFYCMWPSYVFNGDKYDLTGFDFPKAGLRQAYFESQKIVSYVEQHFQRSLSDLINFLCNGWLSEYSKIEGVSKVEGWLEHYIRGQFIPSHNRRLGIKTRGRGNPGKSQVYPKQDKFKKDIIKHSEKLWENPHTRLTQATLCASLKIDVKTYKVKCENFGLDYKTVIKDIKEQLKKGSVIKL